MQAEQPPSVDPQVPQNLGGLVNMGNTCYANATMQAFRHCSRIPWLLTEGRYDTLLDTSVAEGSRRAKQQAVARTYAEVVQMLGRCRRGQSVRPGQFWKTTHAAVEDTGFEHFAQKLPHDSHEFYIFLLDTLHEALATEVDMRILRPKPETVAEQHAIEALERWRKEFSRTYSPFVDLFYGLMHAQIICKACGHVSHSWETFNSLKAAVPTASAAAAAGQAPTLLQMFTAELQPETIEGYACDKCTPTRTTAERRLRIWRLPQVLTVVLKRFTPDGRKIHTPIAPVPLRGLDMKPFFSEESPEKEGITDYELRSVVDHHGSSGGGHYVAQCKGADAQWHLFDDEGVHGIPAPHFGEPTYMLFFERSAGAGAAAVAPEA